jgi:tRNA nucleotidyltransferase (CCA-adding enzyme)
MRGTVAASSGAQARFLARLPANALEDGEVTSKDSTSGLPPLLAQAQLPTSVLEVLRGLHAAGHAAFLVGGGVRDLLRGVPAKDFDVATSALPAQVQAAFKKVIPTGIDHGTVTVLLRGTPVEVTTFRSEGAYVDGRRPSQVNFESKVEDDLSRRDFTINAMAFDPDRGELKDPFHVQVDLAARIVRCVGRAEERFAEDGLRALRAVRFASTLEFTLDPETENAIPRTLAVFQKISRERIRDELLKLLQAPQPSQGLALLARTGLLGAMAPEVFPLDPRGAARVDVTPARDLLRLTAWLEEATSELPVRLRVLESLKLSRKQVEDVAFQWRFAILPAHASAPDPALRRMLAGLGPERLDDAVVHAQARAQTSPEHATDLSLAAQRLRAVREAQPPLNAKALALTGGDVMRILGIGPSPRVGEATRFLLDSVLDDPSLNSRETLEPLLFNWANSRKA